MVLGALSNDPIRYQINRSVSKHSQLNGDSRFKFYNLPWGEEFDEYGLSISDGVVVIRGEGYNGGVGGGGGEGEYGKGEFHFRILKSDIIFIYGAKEREEKIDEGRLRSCFYGSRWKEAGLELAKQCYHTKKRIHFGRYFPWWCESAL